LAACSYSFQLDGDPQAGFAAAKQAITQQGGTLTGSASAGTAKIPSPVGTISMSYAIKGQTLRVDVTDKPWLAPCDKIHDGLAQALTQQPKTTQATAAAKASSVVYGPAMVVTMPAAHGKVMTLDTQYIEGSVPKSPASVWLAVAAAIFGLAVVGGGVWWYKRRR
jgi:hypothetical protein